MPKTEVQIFPNTQAALEKDLTLRCVFQTKYHHEKSRRSAIVIEWAKSHVEKLSKAIIEKAGQPTDGFSTQLNMIQLLDFRNIVYICYDLFLNGCNADLRAEILQNPHLRRPIHMITRKNKIFRVRRDERADEEVFQQYLDMSGRDKGPRPLFHDSKHPPIYADGRRLIEYEERTSMHLPPWWGQEGHEHLSLWAPEDRDPGKTSKDGEQHPVERNGKTGKLQDDVKEGNLETDRKQGGLRENEDMRSA